MSKSNNDVEARTRDAVKRLEAAVDDLTAVAAHHAAESLERAAQRLQDAVARTRGERGEDTPPGEDAPPGARHRRRHARHYRYRYDYRYDYREPLREPTWLWSDKPRTRTLYRDDKNGKILGVCAGIANYYGMESWVVRCLAITGLIFLNWMVLAAYLIAALIMDKGAKREVDHGEGRRGRRGRGRQVQTGRAARAPRKPSSRRQLREAHADLDEIELRLRRMETHVTSGRYELQRELAKIGET